MASNARESAAMMSKLNPKGLTEQNLLMPQVLDNTAPRMQGFRYWWLNIQPMTVVRQLRRDCRSVDRTRLDEIYARLHLFENADYGHENMRQVKS